MAPVLTPYLLDIGLSRGYYSDGKRLLRDWDYRQPADSSAAAYYNAVWRSLLELTFHDELPEDVWPDGGQRWFAVVDAAAGAARQHVVGRRDDRGGARAARRHPAGGDAQRARRADLASSRPTAGSGGGAICTSWS